MSSQEVAEMQWKWVSLVEYFKEKGMTLNGREEVDAVFIELIRDAFSGPKNDIELNELRGKLRDQEARADQLEARNGALKTECARQQGLIRVKEKENMECRENLKKEEAKRKELEYLMPIERSLEESRHNVEIESMKREMQNQKIRKDREISNLREQLKEQEKRCVDLVKQLSIKEEHEKKVNSELKAWRDWLKLAPPEKKEGAESKQSTSKSNVPPPSIPQCSVCLDSLPDIMLIPCNHLAFCRVCIPRILATTKKCTICRTTIKETKKVFYP